MMAIGLLQKRDEVEAALLKALAEKGHACTVVVDEHARRWVVFPEGDRAGQVRIGLEWMTRLRAFQLWVGEYPLRKHFREPKAGLRYGEIADFTVSTVAKWRARHEAAKANERVMDRAEALNKEHGIGDDFGDDFFFAKNVEGRICLAVEVPASDEQIAAMVAAGRACGLIPPKGDPRG